MQTHAPFSAAVQAVYETLKALREGVAPREFKNIASAGHPRQQLSIAAYRNRAGSRLRMQAPHCVRGSA
jgi:carboxyvinyl-carboxyphosphonate phosphorylmutase